MSPQSDALNWNQKRKLLKYFEPSIKQHPDWPVIISEGDSWNGGGNDIVGADLLPLLNQKKPGMQWQDCINRTHDRRAPGSPQERLPRSHSPAGREPSWLQDLRPRLRLGLLGRFHELLAAIAQQTDVTLVPTVGTLAKTDWNDELHPTRKGFEKIAGKFRTELNKQFPGTF